MGTIDRIACDSADQMARVALARMIDTIIEAKNRYGRAVIALAGGRTPRPLYDLMALPEIRRRVPWSSIHLFWGDERAVPPNHPASNYLIASESSLGRAGIDAMNVHRMPAEVPKLETAAAAYERLIKATLGHRADGSTFDLMLLGMGEDGHTASLFPGAPELDVDDRLVVVTDREYAGHRRMTLTYQAINHSREIMVLVSGQSKAAALAKAMAPSTDPHEIPVAGIQPTVGHLVWYADREALSEVDASEWTQASEG